MCSFTLFLSSEVKEAAPEDLFFSMTDSKNRNIYSLSLCVCVCVCVCGGMFMWFMRTQICIMTCIWHRYYKEKVIYEDIFGVPII